MIPKICTLIFAGTLLSVNLLAQDDSNRKDQSINTRQATPVKIIETIPGTWKADKILQNNKDVSTSNAAGNQIIEFGSEARYVIRNGTNVVDSGGYRVNESQSILYLESVTTRKVIEWDINFANDNMTLESKSPASDSRKYIYSRIVETNKR